MEKSLFYICASAVVFAVSAFVLSFMPGNLANGLWILIPVAVTFVGIKVRDRLIIREAKKTDIDAEWQRVLDAERSEW